MVSLGPGFPQYMAPEARGALERAELIVGYKTYIRLVRELFPEKEYVSRGMRQEVERCRLALEAAQEGRHVALVSSGDAGVYGMAGLVLELCRVEGIAVSPPRVTPVENGESSIMVTIIPGISAINAAASRLGAPLMHDFASISLSDHLTPWEVIERRIRCASEGDFVIALYNPRSATRPHLLEQAVRLIGMYREGTTPVGIVWRAMREGERVLLCALDRIPYDEVDMHATLIVGNSRTYLWRGWMITPRGYRVTDDGCAKER